MLHSLPRPRARVGRDSRKRRLADREWSAWIRAHFALTKHAVATLDDQDGAATRIAADQAYAVGQLAMKFGAKPLEAEHLEAFPGFARADRCRRSGATTMVRKFFGP